MKKVALVFVIAVLAPSLVLAWLAVRSLRDQQFLLERQQSLLDQHITDTLAQNISAYLARQQQDFVAQVESLAAASSDARTLAAQFDDRLRKRWPLAEIGFCVTTTGKILAPPPNGRPAAQMFRLDNSGFLGNREPVEVYLTANNTGVNNQGGGGLNSTLNFSRGQTGQPSSSSFVGYAPSVTPQQQKPQVSTAEQANVENSPKSSQQNLAAANPASDSLTSPPEKQELATAKDLNESTASANVTPQAFTLYNSAAKNFKGVAGNQATSQRSPSDADSVTEAPSRQRRQSNAIGHVGSPAPFQAFAISGQFGNSQSEGLRGKDMRNGFSSDSGPSAAAAVPPLTNIAPVAAQEQGQVQTTSHGTYKDASESEINPSQNFGGLNYKAAQTRKVSPQSQIFQNIDKSKIENTADDGQNNLSKVVPAEAEFRQLIGDQSDGMLARFLQNKLKLMCWHRLSAEPDLIFGAQLNLDRVVEGVSGLVQPDRSWGDEICLAVLDDNAKPVVLSRPQFHANWKRPFVATEVGDALPHWEAAAYLVNPAQFTRAAQTAKLTLGLLIAVLVIAIGIGSLLIVRSLGTELKLARQKTDFVSNVSHELKTPLTSIRMFSELLSEGRVADSAKQHSYLQIITAEAARLTRLINNVLDFSRMERGEKKYSFHPCDLTDIMRTTAETFRPHLESSGFKFACELPDGKIPIRGDADALSQIIVNLLSNAEKYSNGGREILLQLAQRQSPLPHGEIKVLDRGSGVPHGCEEKVFEKFYRAHDSLSSGVQGSGLGLTIARQIARAHGGDVTYEAREGGGSCFILRLPVQTS